MLQEQSCFHHLLEPIELPLPFWRYAEIFRGSAHAFLLDSGMDPHKLGRFSFLGGDPFLIFKAFRRRGTSLANVEISGPQQPTQLLQNVDMFQELQQLLASFKVDVPEQPMPFLGGAVGYFGYETNYFTEVLPDIAVDDLRLPTVCFGFYDDLLAHLHETNRTFLSVIGRGDNDRASRRHAIAKRDALLARIATFVDSACRPAGGMSYSTPLVSHFDEASYGRLVRKAREHIFAGDVFEVCLTHRLEAAFAGDSWRLYEELRRINPAPFAAFLKFPEAQVVCSSPERFVRLGRDRIAESRPIKGTRRRGATPAEDSRLERELLDSAKDRAENIMIVDLVRNDFGRVCKFHSVHVPELMIVEKYATVLQLVSTIRGELDNGVTPLQLVKACFPGGSMTGAPKIEAMKIIDRLEPVKRGIYSGSIGYLDYSGALDLNIVIRTLLVKDGRCYGNVGGAIVADSDPRDEYQETMIKAAALQRALASVT